MKVFYDPTNDNQVQAIFTDNTSSTAWDTFSNIIITDQILINKILDFGISSKLVFTGSDVTDVLESFTQQQLRNNLIKRVSREYDDWVDEGVDVSGLSWTTDVLSVLPRDVELLTGVLSIASSQLARGLITDTAEVLQLYKFGNGTIKTGIIERDLEELNSSYQSKRSTRFIAHMNVKNDIASGVMPSVSDYTECGLVASDFDGLGLT
jgi:hypothetical protein